MTLVLKRRSVTSFLRRVRKWLTLQWNKFRTMRRVREIPNLSDPTATALRKIYIACPEIPPDTVSAGIQNGGDAIFVRHGRTVEIFIGRSHDHAAEKVIEWFRREGPGTSEMLQHSKMNRHARRSVKARVRRMRK